MELCEKLRIYSSYVMDSILYILEIFQNVCTHGSMASFYRMLMVQAGLDPNATFSDGTSGGGTGMDNRISNMTFMPGGLEVGSVKTNGGRPVSGRKTSP